MLKHYSKEINTNAHQFETLKPKNETLFAILNYSKSVKVEKVLNKKVVLVLN